MKEITEKDLNEIEQQLLCPICYEHYSEENLPIVFNCGHNICLKCHIKSSDSKACAICKAYIDKGYKNLALNNISKLLFSNKQKISGKYHLNSLNRGKCSKPCGKASKSANTNNKIKCNNEIKLQWINEKSSCSVCLKSNQSCYKCLHCDEIICLKCLNYNFNDTPIQCPCKKFLFSETSQLISCSICESRSKDGLACFDCQYKLCDKCFTSLDNQTIIREFMEEYFGEAKDRVFHGKGILSTFGLTYCGGFKNGMRDGIGTEYYFDSANNYYQGEWKNNKKEGNGVRYFNEKEFYTGEFRNDEFHGKGKLVYLDGGYYEGEFKNGLKHGRGIRFNSFFDSFYKGRYFKGKKHGRGVVIFEDQTTRCVIYRHGKLISDNK